MTHVVILLAASALGVEAGWQPLPEGGHEYTIQIEPALVSVLQNGNDIVSEVPAQVDVRRFRIKLGAGKLARVDGPPRGQVASTANAPPGSAPSAAPGSAAALDLPPPPVDTLAPDSEAPPWNVTQSPAINQPGESLAKSNASAPPSDSSALPGLPPPADDAFADTAAPPPAESASAPAAPAHFEQPPADAQPLADTAASAGGKATSPAVDAVTMHDTQKPSLAGGEDKPWLPLLLTIVVLACSLGANLYLGWIAYDARHRYRDALARVRTA